MVTTSSDMPGKKTQILKPGQKKQADPKKTPKKPTTKPKPAKK